MTDQELATALDRLSPAELRELDALLLTEDWAQYAPLSGTGTE